MDAALRDLLDLLDLEQIDRDIFRGRSPDEGWQRVYGGQVIGQAFVAASRTVSEPERLTHSLHGYFLRPGDTTIPILYDVDRIRDGKSFSTRRVVAIQRGKAIFSMAASFHDAEEGLSHQFERPAAPPPEQCITEQALIDEYIEHYPDAAEIYGKRARPIEMSTSTQCGTTRRSLCRPSNTSGLGRSIPCRDDPRLNQCLLAYASDMTLIDTSYRPHAVNWRDQNFQVASLDHAMWFHRPVRTDEWLLYHQDSPFSGGARGFSRGTFFDQSGQLIASCAQEGLIRLHS